jgi:multidrug efflux system membrane fusion protein
MDRAAIRVAELNLRYTEIRAPFAGRLGRNQASVGTLITTGGTPLNTLVQLDPIYVSFNPSETDMAAIDRARAAGPIEAEVYLPSEAQVRHKGELTFINNVVDRATGTISARATIANADFALLPGQYVRVRLHVGRLSDTLMVPQAAVGSSQLGKYLYVVGEGNKVEQRIVSLGPSDGDAVSALTGVAVGDRVITGNLQRVGPGSLVQPTDPKAASGS